MQIEVLSGQNPWWKGKEKIEQDYDITKWNEKKYRWTPKITEKLNTDPFSLHMILGPRQVGKTTALKLLVKKLLEKDKKDPKSIFYFNCEEISGYIELTDMLETYFTLKESAGIKSSCILLDEITSPKEWYRSIKSAIDRGRLKNDILILTGSSSINVKKHIELFPGRRGKGENILLLPLSFREYLNLTKPEIAENITPVGEITTREFAAKTPQAMIFAKELNAALEQYFITGGFPLSLESDREEAKRAYLSWIKTEVLKAERSDSIAREIVKSLLEKMQTPVSWEGISKEIEIKSPKTVAAYVQLLRSIFSIILLYHADISKKTIKFAKNKKIHVIDPLLLEIFEDWCMSKLKNRESVLAESLVAGHIARYYAKKYRTTTLDEGVFYWKNSFEIDVILNDKEYKGFEVKWTDNFDAKAPGHLKEYMTISKSKFTPKPLCIPLAAFLSLLDVQ